MTLLNTLDYRHAAQKELEINKIVLPVFGQVSQAYQIIIPLKGSQSHIYQPQPLTPTSNPQHVTPTHPLNTVQEFMRETNGIMLKVDKEPDVSSKLILIPQMIVFTLMNCS